MPNAYAIITQQILSQLEAGTVPWRQPWQSRASRKISSPSVVSWHERLVMVFSSVCVPYGSRIAKHKEIGGGYGRESRDTVMFWQFADEQPNQRPKPRAVSAGVRRCCGRIPCSIPLNVELPALLTERLAIAPQQSWLACVL